MTQQHRVLVIVQRLLHTISRMESDIFEYRCVDNGIITGTDGGLGLDDKDLKYCTMIMRIMKK